MGRKCCFALCTSNYDKSKAKNKVLKERNDGQNAERGEHVATFWFPKDEVNRAKWIKAVPYLNEEKYNSYKCAPVLCVKHWPDGFETTKSRNGKIRPLHPPTIFNGVPKSEIPTPGPKPRPTSRTSFEARTRQEDELKRLQ